MGTYNIYVTPGNSYSSHLPPPPPPRVSVGKIDGRIGGRGLQVVGFIVEVGSDEAEIG